MRDADHGRDEAIDMLYAMVDNHRSAEFIACPTDCWCWKVEKLANKLNAEDAFSKTEA